MSNLFIYAFISILVILFSVCFSSDCSSSVIFGGRCWARRWYTSLRAMLYPGFPFSFFLSFLWHMQEDKSFYWNYVSHFRRDLIHVRYRLTFYRVLFIYLMIWSRTTHTELQKIPRPICCLFFMFYAFSSVSSPSILSMPHCSMSREFWYTWLTTQLSWNCLFERTGYLVYVCVNTGGELLGLSLFFYFPGVICGSVLSRRDDGWWMSGWMEWNEWKCVILHTHGYPTWEIHKEQVYIWTTTTTAIITATATAVQLHIPHTETVHLFPCSAYAASVRVCMWRNDVSAYRGQGSKLYVYPGVYQSSKSRAP